MANQQAMKNPDVKQLADHINKVWLRIKKRKYPFMSKDFGMLKILLRSFTLAETMAMFDAYAYRSPFWSRATGMLISGFFNERSILLDDPNFKQLVKKYEAELNLKTPEQVCLELGL